MTGRPSESEWSSSDMKRRSSPGEGVSSFRERRSSFRERSSSERLSGSSRRLCGSSQGEPGSSEVQGGQSGKTCNTVFEKIDNFIKTAESSDDHSTLEAEIIDDMKSFLEDLIPWVISSALIQPP